MQANPELVYRRFGLRLRAWRNTERLTAKQLASRIHGSDTYVLAIEGGLKPPPYLDSVIGDSLYALMGSAPLPQEHFLWSQLHVAEESFQELAMAVLGHYSAGDSDPLKPLGQLRLPPALDASSLITALGGPSAIARDYADRLSGIPEAVVVDWLLQSTHFLGFEFFPFGPEEALENGSAFSLTLTDSDHHTEVFLRALLRWSPAGDSDEHSMMVPYSVGHVR